MQIIKPGDTMDARWKAEFTCTGKGNGNQGCDAVLEITEDDLYGTYNSCMGRDETHFVTFLCPCCGAETDVSNTDGYRHPNFPTSGRLGTIPQVSRDRVRAAQQRLKNGGGYVSPRGAVVKHKDATMLEPGDVLWVMEHHRNMHHRSADKDGVQVLCGVSIPGSPTVTRRSDRWEPSAEQRCPKCEALYGKS